MIVIFLENFYIELLLRYNTCIYDRSFVIAQPRRGKSNDADLACVILEGVFNQNNEILY